MRPRLRLLIELVHLSARLARVGEVNTFDFLRLDDDDAKVLACNWIFEVFNLAAEFEVLVIVWCRGWLAWRWCCEGACKSVSMMSVMNILRL